jgi:hypothetical protein
MKYKFIESFSFNGVYYERGQTYELTPEIIAALSAGIAEPETVAKPAK